MSRQIKFRAWDNKNKRMYYQGEPDLETIQSFFHHYNENDVLMQFTGLHDKNGKEIYEGDLFRQKDIYNYLMGDDYIRRDTLFEIVFDETGYFLKVVKSNTEHLQNHRGSYKKGQILFINEKKLNIIGNIYENKELLK